MLLLAIMNHSRQSALLYLPNVVMTKKTDVLDIELLKSKIKDDRFEFSEHALDQSIIRFISVREVREAFATGELVEDYPDDNRGPSCLILGYTESGRPLHIICSYPSRDIVKIVTLYEPGKDAWIENRYRKN